MDKVLDFRASESRCSNPSTSRKSTLGVHLSA